MINNNNHNKNKNKQRKKQTNKQRNKQTNKQTNKERKKERTWQEDEQMGEWHCFRLLFSVVNEIHFLVSVPIDLFLSIYISLKSCFFG